MSTIKKRMFCPEDVSMVLAERNTPNHVLHLLMSLVTVGLWIPVWIIMGIVRGGAYRCPKCGGKTLSYVPKRFKDEMETRQLLRD